MQNVTEMLQQWYGIWADGHTIGVEQLPSQDTDIVHTARMLRDRLQHLMAALPDTDTDADKATGCRSAGGRRLLPSLTVFALFACARSVT